MSETDRRILAIGGDERREFLQGLVSNDVPDRPGILRYGALLSPQGKYLADFFLFETGDALCLDVAAPLFDDLKMRLTMYRLRRKLSLDELPLPVHRGTGPVPDGALPDPRHPAMGWRGYGAGFTDQPADWDGLRVAHCIPGTGVELIPNDSYILEAGFERLNGVDFRKGCYVGQEVTARMKHKIELKKGLVTVAVDGVVPVGTEILAGDKPAGTLFTQSGGQGIAYLRFDRSGPLTAAGVSVRREV